MLAFLAALVYTGPMLCRLLEGFVKAALPPCFIFGAVLRFAIASDGHIVHPLQVHANVDLLLMLPCMLPRPLGILSTEHHSHNRCRACCKHDSYTTVTCTTFAT